MTILEQSDIFYSIFRSGAFPWSDSAFTYLWQFRRPGEEGEGLLVEGGVGEDGAQLDALLPPALQLVLEVVELVCKRKNMSGLVIGLII